MDEKWDHANLKAGDPVAYSYYRTQWDRRALVIRSTVERFTATQIVLADSRRFRRTDGGMIGGNGRSGQLLDPSGSEMAEQNVREEYWRTRRAIEELLRTKECATGDALAQWQDRLTAVVEQSRARLREIGGDV